MEDSVASSAGPQPGPEAGAATGPLSRARSPLPLADLRYNESKAGRARGTFPQAGRGGGGPMRKADAVAAALAAILAAAGAVWADGDTRPATPGEKAFVGRVHKVLCEAIPQPPAGWKVARSSEVPSLTTVAGSGVVHPIEVFCERAWEDPAKLQAAQARMMDAYQAVKPDPKLEARAKELEKKQADLFAAMTAAAQKGDQAKMQEIQKQLDPVSKEYQKVLQAQTQGFVDAAKAGVAKDATATVTLTANHFYEYLSKPVKEAPVSGASVYRVEPAGSTQEEGTTWAFLGPWRAVEEGGAVSLRADEKPGSTAVRTILVKVKAERGRARATLEKVDWAALRGLLSP